MLNPDFQMPFRDNFIGPNRCISPTIDAKKERQTRPRTLKRACSKPLPHGDYIEIGRRAATRHTFYSWNPRGECRAVTVEVFSYQSKAGT